MGKTKHVVLGIGLLALLVTSITYATNHETSTPAETSEEEDTQFIEEEPEVTYDLGITGVADPVYGTSKGKKGLLLVTGVENDVDGKAKSSIKIRCQAQPATGDAFNMGEYVKNFKTKSAGTEKRRFFYPLDERGAKFVRRTPTDGGKVSCTLNLPNYVKIKKETFQDFNPDNDAVQITINWSDKKLRGSFERIR